jgi:mRNA interferase MazF
VTFGNLSLDPTIGREQSGRRPALVISVDNFNKSRADLVVTLPITTKAKGIPYHVLIRTPEGGLTQDSFIKCEDIRSISKLRLVQRIGTVSDTTLKLVQGRMRMLLGLP